MFRGKLFYLVIAGILGALIFSVVLFQGALKVETLPIYGKVNDFRLLDTEGREFTLKDLKGKVWLADFIFTTCGGICPVMTKNMASLHRSYRLLNDVAMVSISVNPEYDTPSVLAQFAKKYDADTNRWYFLTGPRKDIEDLAIKNFKVGSAEESIFHSSYFILVDRYSNIRGYYDGTETNAVQKLFKDVFRVLKEQ